MTHKQPLNGMSRGIKDTQNLTRRSALVGAGLSVLAAPALAQTGPRTIRMATSWPANLGGLADSAARVARSITQASEGRLNVELYTAGELVAPLGVHDAAGAGEIEMYHSAEYYFQSKHRGLNFFCTVPLGLTSVEQIAWLRHGGGQELWDELNAGFGVKALAVGGTGVQMGGWFNKAINSIEDFKGLTMRMPGLGAQVIKRLGATAVSLPGGGIVDALFDGTIDATEWVGPYNDLQFGFQKLLTNYIYPGFHEPATTASVGFNLDFWNGLSESDQLLISGIVDADLTYHTADYYGNNGIALAQMLAESGTKPTKLPEDVWRELARVSFEVTASVADDDDMGRRIVESYEAYRALVGNAAQMSQAEYLAKRGATDLFSEV